MEARMDSCCDKGFDGIEPDNIDGFPNDTGFDLTYENQLAFKICPLRHFLPSSWSLKLC
jgi:hypothetical protein